MYYDAHTHLNDDKLFPDWQQHVASFVEAGGQEMVVIGVDHKHNQRAIAIAQQSKHVHATIGIHPGEVAFGNIATESDVHTHIQQLEDLYTSNKEYIVAIGECGLDAHYEGYTHNQQLQKFLFEQQCSLAEKLQLPIVIHTRDQRPDTLEILAKFTDLKIYLHCRGYGEPEIKAAVDTLPNLWIGRCGNTTYPKAQTLRDSLQTYLSYSDHPQFVLETDAPYLSPQNKRGQTNCPLYIIDLYQAVAEILSISTTELQHTVQQNYKALYH